MLLTKALAKLLIRIWPSQSNQKGSRKAVKGKAVKGKAVKGKAVKGKAVKGKAVKGKAVKGYKEGRRIVDR
jgi:hypothetical protein